MYAIRSYYGDLYGKRIQVRLCHKLRDEKKFDSFASLKLQIEQDALAARHFFGLPVSRIE